MITHHHIAAKRLYRHIVFTCSTIVLVACGGENESVVGTPLGDPVSVQTAIAYIERPLLEADENSDPLIRINPGAKLISLSSASVNASKTVISDQLFGAGTLYDIKDLSVSSDGKNLLFAAHAPEVDLDDPQFTWNIWEYETATNTLTRVINDNFLAEEGDDIQPAYLASGEIVFSSNRQHTNKGILLDEGKPQYSGQKEDSARNSNPADHALVLHSINATDQIQQLTFNQSHDYEPLTLTTGEVLYTREDDIANNNRLSLYRVNPSGGNVSLRYGYHSQNDIVDGGVGFVTHKTLGPGGQLFGILAESEDNAVAIGGDLIEIDIDNFVDLSTPTASNLGLTTNAIESIAVNTVDIDNEKSPGGRYAAVWPLHDGSGRLLVSWSPCRALDNGLIKPCSISPLNAPAADPLFSLWVYDPVAKIQQPIVNLTTEGRMISDVVAFEDRQPNAIALETIDTDLAEATPAQLGIINIRSIYDIDGIDGSPTGILNNADPALTDPATIPAKFVRLVKAVSIPDEDVLDFDNSIIGINTTQTMREIVGYIPIEPDGSVRAIVPANIPLMLNIVDANGRRTHTPRHENWIHVGPGTTLECVGCHANGSTEPHGRADAQPPSVHLGAPIVTLPYPNTETALFAPNGGETMAEIFSSANVIAGRSPTVDIIYIDDWTDDTQPALSKSPAFAYLYQNLTTPMPVSTDCQTNWNGGCRIVINYPIHIQPIWNEPRTPVDDGSGTLIDRCTGCHSTNGNTQIPAGQLDLTSTPSDIDADRMTSYHELLRADGEQALNGGTVSQRNWDCNQVDPNTNLPIPDPLLPGNFLRETRTPTGVAPSLNESGANFGVSPIFFSCLSANNSCFSHNSDPLPAGFPDECVEIGGTPLAAEAVINHNGMLSTDELRLISEWVDLGAQYYNNPFDAP